MHELIVRERERERKKEKDDLFRYRYISTNKDAEKTIEQTNQWIK
jgi:hypothetical protein